MRRWILCLTIVSLFLGLPVYAESEQSYVLRIPVETINPVTLNKVRTGLKEVQGDPKIKGIIFEINTYGGRVDSAEEMKNLILRESLPTVAFVNNKAESAGVLITLSCDRIAINRFASIGSSETVPNSEKVLSMWTALLRDTAEQTGRDPRLVEAMARREGRIDGLKEEGTLLNLTASQALNLGLADYQVNDLSEILTQEGWEDATIRELEPHVSMTLAEWLCHPFISTLLLMIAFVALVVELFMPGFGVPGFLSIISFALYFIGHFIAGNTPISSLAFFGLGLLLLGLEMIVPGFGLPGISGMIFIALGLISATGDLVAGMGSLSLALLVAIAVAIVIVKKGYRSPWIQKVVLDTSFTKDLGYLPAEEKEDLLGEKAVAVTDLRPSGIIEIGSERYDALTEGEFIERGREVTVSRVVGNKIFVRAKEVLYGNTTQY